MPQLLHVHTDHEIVITRPANQRYMWVVLVVLVSGMFALLLLLPNTKSNHNTPMSHSDWVTYWEVCAVALVFALAASGPATARFDTEGKTYAITTGFPPFARTVRGPVSDIERITIKRIQGSNSRNDDLQRDTTAFLFRVDWNSDTRSSKSIGFIPEERLNSVVAEIEQKLELPVRWEE